MMPVPEMKSIERELRQARYVAQLEHNAMAYKAANESLARENAALEQLCEFQLRVMANTAAQYAELTKIRAEDAVAFLREKIALLERAEAAEKMLIAVAR